MSLEIPSRLPALAPAFAFGPERKVKRHADFQRIQAGGRTAGHPATRETAALTARATSPHFVFLVSKTLASPEVPPAASRLGLVVTKKVGNAVERNRVKRVCRECFRLWPDFVPPGVDLVVIARQGAPSLDLAGVRREWSRAQGALRHRAREVLAQPPGEPHVAPRGPETDPPGEAPPHA